MQTSTLERKRVVGDYLGWGAWQLTGDEGTYLPKW